MEAVCVGLAVSDARRRSVQDADLDALADRDVVGRLAPLEQTLQGRHRVDVQRLAPPRRNSKS